MTRIIIIGGGAAGPKTAAKLRRTNSEYIIDLYTEENVVSYSSCGLPYYIEGIIPDISELLVRSPSEFAKHGINIHLKQKCVKINKENRSVNIVNLETNEEFEEFYDILVIATGARPYVPPIKNVDTGNVFTLRKLADGINIKNAMRKAKRVTLAGCGFLGLELTEAFVKNGLEVNVVEREEHILSTFDDEFSERLKSVIEEHGNVKIHTNDTISRMISENGNVKRVLTYNGKEIDTDFAVICAGVVPNSELARQAGLKLGVGGSIKVNNHFKTSYPTIYAAGDCCEKLNIVTHDYCWLPLGSTANKEGRCAAMNIANEQCDFDGVTGAMVGKYFDFTVSMTGISEKDALKAGFRPISATVTKPDRVGYMPGAAEITLKVTVDANSRRILGAQATGYGDAEKRISSITTAITSGQNIDEFTNLDLPYAPPYSPAIDPILNAFQIISDKLERRNFT